MFGGEGLVLRAHDRKWTKPFEPLSTTEHVDMQEEKAQTRADARHHDKPH